MEPVVICFGAVVEFRQIHDLDGCEPVNKFWFPDFRGIGAYYFEELVFQSVRIRIAVAPETLNCVPIFEADTVSRNAVMISATSRLVER